MCENKMRISINSVKIFGNPSGNASNNLECEIDEKDASSVKLKAHVQDGTRCQVVYTCENK